MSRFLDAQQRYAKKFEGAIRPTIVAFPYDSKKHKRKRVLCFHRTSVLARVGQQLWISEWIRQSQAEIVWERQVHVPASGIVAL